MHCLFFFSSRRRHTRFKCDWSSDVCSSDLLEIRAVDSGRQLQSDLERLKVSASSESPEARAKTLSERKSKLEAVLAERAQALQAMESGAPGRTEGYASVLRALARLSMDGVWLTRVRFSDE